jgi:hypothetical protein
MLTSDELKRLIHYDPYTGIVTRITSPRKSTIGKVASSINNTGHLQMCLAGRNYALHRIIWLYVYGDFPTGMIDHIDGNPINNRIDNLRIADASINAQNRTKPRIGSKSGFIGVCWNNGKWMASITANGKRYYLGRFDCKEKASEAYILAKKTLHPESYIALEGK